MANGEAGRKAHVKRVFAFVSGSTSDIDTDIWIDVLRLDKVPVAFGSTDDGIVGQVTNQIFHWNDDPNDPKPFIDASNADSQGEDANAARKTEQLEVKDPDNPDDSEHVKLWIINKTRVKEPTDRFGKVGQVVTLVFHNRPRKGEPPVDDTGPIADRKFLVIKVTNNDLDGLTMADDDGSNPRLVDWNDYKDALQNGTNDDSQHLTVEVTERYKQIFQPEESGKIGQEINIALGGNRAVARLFEVGNPSAVDANGNPCVLRTDPLQTIVNVGFGGLAVEFFDGAA